MYRRQQLHPVLNLVSIFRSRQTRAIRSPLIPLKQTSCVYLEAEELWRVQLELSDHTGRALRLHALHDVLDRARAEVVGAQSEVL